MGYFVLSNLKQVLNFFSSITDEVNEIMMYPIATMVICPYSTVYTETTPLRNLTEKCLYMEHRSTETMGQSGRSKVIRNKLRRNVKNQKNN